MARKFDIYDLADREVEAIRKNLPADIAAAAKRVPVFLEATPHPSLVEEEGFEPDLLGLFDGPDYGAEIEANGDAPRIFLYLENLLDLAEGDRDIFREEVRMTYLHELGHYFGWDEDEVARRGLA